MEIKEENKTRKWIIDALFALLKRRDYRDITINQIVNQAGLGRRTFYRYFKSKDEVMEYTTKLLMNDFAAKIIANSADTLETVARSYFEFWEGYIDILLLLNKAHLLYFVEDHLLSLIYEAALKSGHVSAEISKEILEKQYDQYQYEFAFKLAGFWKVTILWCSESPRKRPEEMSKIISAILK